MGENGVTIMSKNEQRSASKLDLDLGFKIRQIRQKKEMSLNEVADLIGISSQQLRKYELGRNRISAQRLEQISRVLGVTSAQLMDINRPINTNNIFNIDKEAERLWLCIENVEHKNAILKLMQIAIDKTPTKQPKGNKI
jgi:transcriptional regulator with XRE-family HTH domain